MVSYRNVKSNSDEEFDIVFELAPHVKAEDMPQLDKDLYSTVESVTIVIKNLQGTSDKIKNKYFKKLLSLAQAGGVGENPNAELALLSMNLLKEEILTLEGHRIKNSYMMKLGFLALFGISLCWVLYLFLHSLNLDVIDMNYFNVWTGAMVGTWISFGARKFHITFEELSVIEEDKMSIYVRLPYIGVCSLIFLLFLNSGIFNLEIGSLSLETMKDNNELYLLIGVLAGLLESKLGNKIYAKAESLTSSL